MGIVRLPNMPEPPTLIWLRTQFGGRTGGNRKRGSERVNITKTLFFPYETAFLAFFVVASSPMTQQCHAALPCRHIFFQGGWGCAGSRAGRAQADTGNLPTGVS